MKIIVSFVFLSLLFMKIGGYFVFLTVQQNIFREEAKERILKLMPSDKITQFCFTEKQFTEIEWKESDKEFYFNGTLYDVVNTKVEGKNRKIYCISDEKETEIYAEILQMSKVQKDELPVKTNLISFLNLLILKYTVPQILCFEGNSTVNVEKPDFAKFVPHYLSIPFSIVIPPPEI